MKNSNILNSNRKEIAIMENFLGIDIGGQGIKLRYENGQGQVFSQVERTGKLTVEQVQMTIMHFMQINAISASVLGISQTGIVGNNELLASASQPYLVGMNEKSFQKIGIENAFILNDGKAMAFAASKKYEAKDIVAIAAGTGVGIGIIVDGKVIEGVNNKAGEIHTIPVETEEGMKYLGDLCSGRATVKKFGLDYMKQHDKSPEVKEEIRKAGKYMGLYIIMAKHFLDPDVIYLTGGATTFYGYFEAAMDYVRKNMPTIDEEKTIIVKSTDAFFDGCIGAEWYAHLQKQSIL